MVVELSGFERQAISLSGPFWPYFDTRLRSRFEMLDFDQFNFAKEL
jgi:hypothetical protein